MTAPRVDAGAQILTSAAMAPVLFFFALVMVWAGAAWWFLRWAARQIEPQDIEEPGPAAADGQNPRH